MTHFDSLQVGSAVTSATAATAATMMQPHPLQILGWLVAIAAGLFSIYRGWAADRKERNG
jgi:hypothetical protein